MMAELSGIYWALKWFRGSAKSIATLTPSLMPHQVVTKNDTSKSKS